MHSRERTFAVGPKDKTVGCSYEKVTGSRGVESFQLKHLKLEEKQWEKGEMEREDQRKSKATGILELL